MRSRFMNKSAHTGFILLEVVLSIMILGVAIAALMRSFTVSLATARKTQVVTTACLLAQQVLEEYEVVPPQDDHAEGNFGIEEDLYAVDGSSQKQSTQYKNYYWILDVEEVPVDYPDVSFEGEKEDFENLTKLSLTIIYDDGHMKRFTPVRLETYLTNAEKFTYSSKKDNKFY